ncbi:BTB/POZ protein [Rhizophagus clarus]|uniref:BTB/POZ protein n=1 Tax=Rhizophagus clarus TaxID=94130 RepID=A0A8H3MA15_9GLOM|nr:BTB/POZ protein [Rhizophagus clarus]
MSSKFLTELSNDYEKLFETEVGYDVIIYAGEGQNVREIHAHSNILCIRSQYFRSAFSNEWSEKKDGKFIFKKPNISPQLFNIILRFIYCGNIELKNLQGPDVLKLLIAVDELNIHSLVSHIQEFLIDHQTEFLQQNPTGILETVYQHETFTDLWNYCLEEICKEPKVLFSSEEYTNLKAPLLELLLKRDDLNMDEIEIWENLLKWCFTQHNMENDPSKWNKEDITKIERALFRFIPLIRFYDIKPTDFFYKVYCYKGILPQDLIHDFLEFHIVPNMKPKDNLPPSRKPNLKYQLDSTLIESNHIPIFSSWIDKKDSSHYNKKYIPYDFKLLYRSSRDGNDTDSFHRNCDNKGATIWIAKIKNSEQLIGGYNPLDWDVSYTWKTTADSFLFNFTNGNNILTAKMSYVNSTNLAVFCGSGYGPTMGIPTNFEVEDYEVFQECQWSVRPIAKLNKISLC